MLAIKLQKIGRKHQPSFRLVVAEKRSKLISPPIEDLGSYQPDSKILTCNRDRVLFWIDKGAQPTDTVHNLLVKSNVIVGPKKDIKTRKPDPKEEVAPAVETPKAEVAEDKSQEKPAEEVPQEAVVKEG